MREELDRVLGQATVITLAIGIAVGWSLFQVAKGAADLVNGLLTKQPDGAASGAVNFLPATWVVGRRVLTFGSLIAGIVELAVVLLVASWILRRTPARPAP